ncbi:hypothetical protein RyT2_05840 [Pseudolactococcus yaeyamensis]
MDKNITESKLMIITDTEGEKKALMAYDKLQRNNRYSVYVALESTPCMPDMDYFDRIYVEMDNYQKLFDHIPAIEVAVPISSQVDEDIQEASLAKHEEMGNKEPAIIDKLWSGEFRRPPKGSWEKTLASFDFGKQNQLPRSHSITFDNDSFLATKRKSVR